MTMTTAPPGTHPIERQPSSARVWPALARREALFMLRHPLILVGILASVYVLWSLNRDTLPHLAGYSTYVGMGLAPFAGASLLVAHLQTSRAQRHRTLEIEEPTPAAKQARTFGHLLGSLAVVPVAVAVVTAYMVYLYRLGGAGQPDIGELLVGPLVVGLAGIAGVAAGTWFPNRFGGLIGLGAVAFIQIALQDAPGTLHWFAWWHTVLWYGGFDLWIRPTWAHVAYLIGVMTIVSAAASFRHGIRIAPTAMAAIGAVLVLVGGAIQAQLPSDAEVEAAWDRIANPDGYWVTMQRDNVAYKIHPGYERWVDWWDLVISDTLAPISPNDRPALVVEQWHHPFPSQILDEFGRGSPRGQALLERANGLFFGSLPADPWPIRVGSTLYLEQRTPLAIAVAQRAVGLPLLSVQMEGPLYTEEEIVRYNYEPTDPTETMNWPGREWGLPRPVMGDRVPLAVACDAEGQAREVIAAWLAGQGSPRLVASYRDIRRRGVSSTLNGGALSEYWPGDAESPTAVIQWSSLGWMRQGGFGGGNGASAVNGSPTATDLAAQLFERPYAEVATGLAENWDEWANPTTSIQAIVEYFDLEPPPTPEQWIERGGRDPSEFLASIAVYPRWNGDDLLGDQPFPICK